MELIGQEVTQDRYIEIPEEVQNIYKLYRPSPLYRARNLEKVLDTPAKIFYKYEGVSPTGSHKPNTAIPQAFYNKQEGVKKLTTETGAGQWGSSLAFAGQHFGIEIEVQPLSLLLRSLFNCTFLWSFQAARCICNGSFHHPHRFCP